MYYQLHRQKIYRQQQEQIYHQQHQRDNLLFKKNEIKIKYQVFSKADGFFLISLGIFGIFHLFRR